MSRSIPSGGPGNHGLERIWADVALSLSDSSLYYCARSTKNTKAWPSACLSRQFSRSDCRPSKTSVCLTGCLLGGHASDFGTILHEPCREAFTLSLAVLAEDTDFRDTLYQDLGDEQRVDFVYVVLGIAQGCEDICLGMHSIADPIYGFDLIGKSFPHLSVCTATVRGAVVN